MCVDFCKMELQKMIQGVGRLVMKVSSSFHEVTYFFYMLPDQLFLQFYGAATTFHTACDFSLLLHHLRGKDMSIQPIDHSDIYQYI